MSDTEKLDPALLELLVLLATGHYLMMKSRRIDFQRSRPCLSGARRHSNYVDRRGAQAGRLGFLKIGFLKTVPAHQPRQVIMADAAIGLRKKALIEAIAGFFSCHYS